MITASQAEKLEIASKLLADVTSLDTDKKTRLEDAQNDINELLAEYYPEGYLPPKYSPIRLESAPRPYRTWQDTLFAIASETSGTMVMVAFISGCISLTCWGLSDLKGAMGYKGQPDFAASTQAYRGLAIAGLGITLTASTIAASLGAKKNV